MEVQDVYEELPDPGPNNAGEDNEYVADNVLYERHIFRQLVPRQGETADKFMVRLRKQARQCNFCATLDKYLRHQLIEKLSDVELKTKLIEVNNIILEVAMDNV